MRDGRPARAWMVGVGIAIAAMTLGACASGTEDSASTGSSQSAPGQSDSGNAAGIVESGSGQQDPELVGSSSGKVSAPVGDQLVGREYVATKVEGFTPATDSKLRVAFPEAGHISILGGCNTLFGEVTWQDSVLLAPTLASTMMACEQSLMDQDQTMTRLLAHGMKADIAGDTLTLSTDEVTIELELDENSGIGEMEQPIPAPGETSTASGD